MKTINNLLAVIFIACFMTLLTGQRLTAQNTEYSRLGATGFSIGAKGYIGTGCTYLNGVFTAKKDFWEYDPATDSWTQKADLGGVAREAATGFSIENLGYIGTGVGGNWLNDFWEYNPAQNKWTIKANFGGPARENAVGFSLGKKGYIGTGYVYMNGLLNNLKDFWEFTPSSGNGKGTWKRVADLPGNPRYAAVAFGIGQKAIIATGINYVDSEHYTFYKDCWEYDPNTNPKTGGKWTQKTDLPAVSRAFAVGFSINGTKGYIGTGNSGKAQEGFKKDFWEYDPGNLTTGPWTRKADFPGRARDCDVGFAIGNKGYIGLGLAGASYDTLAKDFWQFDPGTIPGGLGTWLQMADFGLHRGLLKDAASSEISDQLSNEELIVYPNPSNSTFNFSLKTTSEELVTIQIFDMLGRLLHEYKSLSPDDVMTVKDILNVGVYFAVVTQGEYRKTIKLSKVN